MKKLGMTAALAAAGILLPLGSAFANYHSAITVTPFAHDDPNFPNLVTAEWRRALGCPTNPTLASDPTTGLPMACTGSVDDYDRVNAGLLLSKQGPSSPVGTGEAGATLNGIQGTVVPAPDPLDVLADSIGYDIRKNLGVADPAGSHCGTQSPRIEIVTTDNVTHSYYCADGTPLDAGFFTLGWTRLRWEVSAAIPPIAPGQTIQSARVVLDEGQDGVPDGFGLAVLDNFFIFGTYVGTGDAHPTPYADEDEGQGEDRDHDSCQYRDSPSHPDEGSMRYSDKSKKMSVTSVNGVRSIAYTGTALTGRCVSFSGDAYVNGKPGYVYSFQSCQVPGAIGNFNISISGPGGFAYQKTAPLTSGYVHLH